MKKSLKIIIAIVIIIIIVGILYVIDNTRTIEVASDEVVKIAKSKDGENITGFPYAYSLVQTEDKIVFSLYCANEVVKITHTYDITNGIITKTSYEKHYNNKWQAKTSNDDLKNKQIDKNTVKGILISDESAIGENAETLIENITSTYGNLPNISE